MPPDVGSMFDDNLFTDDIYPEADERSSNRRGRKPKPTRKSKPGDRPAERPMLFDITTYEMALETDPQPPSGRGQTRPNPREGDYLQLERGTCVIYDKSPGAQAGHDAGRRVFRYVKKGTIFGPVKKVEHTFSFVACLVPVKDPVTGVITMQWFNPWGDFNPDVHKWCLEVAGTAFYSIIAAESVAHRNAVRSDRKAGRTGNQQQLEQSRKPTPPPR